MGGGCGSHVDDSAGRGVDAQAQIDFMSCNIKSFSLGAEYAALWEVCGAPVHLLLLINEDVKCCRENKVLQRLEEEYAKCFADDVDDADEDDLEDAAHACWLLFRPYLAQLQQVLQGTHLRPAVGGIAPGADSVYRVQVKTVGGYLVAIQHDLVYNYDIPSPVPNPVPGVVKEVPADQVKVQRSLPHSCAIVCVDQDRRFLKPVHSAPSEQAFINEAVILSHLPRHSSLVPLLGVVVLPDGTVDGLLLELVDGVPLSEWRPPAGGHTAGHLKRQWLDQIRAGVSAVHGAGCVWGDAKPSNIMIDGQCNARLVDFGGGYTPAFVPQSVAGTRFGDAVGVQSIAEFVASLP